LTIIIVFFRGRNCWELNSSQYLFGQQWGGFVSSARTKLHSMVHCCYV